jgi:succinate dehydrogenase / fumarate reductase flavoprotein subunit/L-aspartate oxidase
MAYRAGVKTTFMHSTQYHPTGAAYPEQNVGLLITEKTRGLGAHVLNKLGEQFCFPLEPRDIESALLIRECTERDNGVITPTGRLGVWLDSPMIDILHGPGTAERELPAKFIQFKRYDIDISKEPMLVYPTLHYQSGGIFMNAQTETSLKGLYSAGEVSGGIHGDNRLMGNSLLDILTFGTRAGKVAAHYVKSGVEIKKLNASHLTAFEDELKKAGIKDPLLGPMVLPDYTTDQVKGKQWTAHYEGTLR